MNKQKTAKCQQTKTKETHTHTHTHTKSTFILFNTVLMMKGLD